jgi:hypothetical protein
VIYTLNRIHFASPEKKRDFTSTQSAFSVHDLQLAIHQSCLPICHQVLPLQRLAKVRIAILEVGGATGEEAGIGMFAS